MEVRSTVFDSSLMSRLALGRLNCSRDFFLLILRSCKPKRSSSSSSRMWTLGRCSGILRSVGGVSFETVAGEDVSWAFEFEPRGCCDVLLFGAEAERELGGCSSLTLFADDGSGGSDGDGSRLRESWRGNALLEYPAAALVLDEANEALIAGMTDLPSCLGASISPRKPVAATSDFAPSSFALRSSSPRPAAANALRCFRARWRDALLCRVLAVGTVSGTIGRSISRMVSAFCALARALRRSYSARWRCAVKRWAMCRNSSSTILYLSSLSTPGIMNSS